MSNLSPLEVSSARMDLYQAVRDYFSQSGAIEVEVPLLAAKTTTDPHINSFLVDGTSGLRYLQSSPEFFLKRLLSDNPQSIFTITKAFRDEEFGGNHNPEFSMLEWYRLDFKLADIIEDTLTLVRQYLGDLPLVRETYFSIFQRYLQLDPHQASLQDLQELVVQHTNYGHDCVSVEEALQLLLTECIEPQFQPGITVLSEFPVSQAALSEVEPDANGRFVAKRFEIYLGKVELANGYQELTDSLEQRSRFERDNLIRQKLGRATQALDEALLEAMDPSLPPCSGVSIGLDRLLMAKLDLEHIDSVLLFPWNKA